MSTARKLLVASLVSLHFLLGILVMLPQEAALRRVALLDVAIRWYDWNSFRQNWMMFAPPARNLHVMGYSLHFDDGWTELAPVDQHIYLSGQGRLIAPRGMSRLVTHLRHPFIQKGGDLAQDKYIRDFYQKLAAFYCEGDGAIEGLRAIRFYSITKGIAPLYESTDPDVPTEVASDRDSVVPLYEMECESP